MHDFSPGFHPGDVLLEFRYEITESEDEFKEFPFRPCPPPRRQPSECKLNFDYFFITDFHFVIFMIVNFR